MTSDYYLRNQQVPRGINIKHHVKSHFDDEPRRMEFFDFSRKEECLISHQCLKKTERFFRSGISNY